MLEIDATMSPLSHSTLPGLVSILLLLLDTSLAQTSFHPCANHDDLFNLISNYDYDATNTASNLMANGDIVTLSSGTYKANGSGLRYSNDMIYALYNLVGTIDCVDVPLSCVIDGSIGTDTNQGRRIMMISNTKDSSLDPNPGFNFHGISFENGISKYDAGAIDITDSEVTFRYCSFRHNNALNGGAMVLYRSTADLYGVMFEGNIASTAFANYPANFEGGDDIYMYGENGDTSESSLNIHDTCPIGYEGNVMIMGEIHRFEKSGE